MPNPRLAARYAKSLIDLAIEKNSLEETMKDMQLIEAICHQNADFVSMMRSPVIKADKKQAIIEAILSGKIGVLTSGFIKLLISKGREQNLDEIASAFIHQYRSYKRIKMIRLTTAAPVSSEVSDLLRTKIQTAFPDNTIDFHVDVNADLIGGFVLEMEDRQMDASVLRDLNDIKKQFTKNLYVSQLR